MATSRLLEEGRTRVLETTSKGYAPAHFPHNLELIFVDDTRSSTSLSMRTKIASTLQRSAVLRTLEPTTLIWWAVAFPMRQWSGGRNMTSFAFDSLDDLDGLRLKHPFCQPLQDFLNRNHVRFTGAQYGCLEKLPDLLRDGMENSRKFQQEQSSQARVSTAFDIFVPTDPTNHDAYAVVPIGSNKVWQVLYGL
ncbi:hypothetical protein FGRMN_11214, partial [Fusarium graminum]